MPAIIGYLLNVEPRTQRVGQGNGMSLIRTGLVLGAVVYALPTDPQKQQELARSASDTIVWGATYCQREPETCRQAGVIWTQAVAKAKFGVALASDVASKWSEQRQTAANAEMPGSTLTIEDALAAVPDDLPSQEPVAQSPAAMAANG